MDKGAEASQSNTSQQSTPQMANTPMNLSTPIISSATPGPMTPQAQQQMQQAQQSQMLQKGHQQRQFPHITPQQAHQLLQQFNIEKEGAQNAGIQTAEGKEHVRKAERIKAILIQYNRRQKMLAAQRQQQQQQQRDGAGAQIAIPQQMATPRPQAQSQPQNPQLSRVASQNSQEQLSGSSPLMANQSPENLINEQLQQPQEQSQPGSSGTAGSMGSLGSLGPIGSSGSPGSSSSAGSSGHPDLSSMTPAQQMHVQKQQQLAKYQQIIKLAEQFRNQLRAIEARKSDPNTPANAVSQLDQKEREIKTRMEQCRRYAQQIASRLRLMQRAQQGQQGQNQSPQQAQQAQPGQFQAQITPQQKQALQQQLLLQQRKHQQQQLQQQLQAQTRNGQGPSVGQTPLSSQNPAAAQTPIPSTTTPSTPASASKLAKHKPPRKNQKKASKGQIEAGKNKKNQTKTTPKQRETDSLPLAQQAQLAQQTQSQLQPQQVPPPVQAAAQSQAQSQPQFHPNATITSVNAAASKPVSVSGGSTAMAASPSGSYSMRPRFQNISIPDELKVTTPEPTSVRMNNRPSLLGGSAIDAPALTNPALVRPQHFDIEGERVLNKRKLRELVRYVASEEGDTDVTIDGDVEDLLLDLADEFVTSVTSFACRLAKHRKSDSLDVRDVQLHLERNWNIRIPGYATDEIRSTRKFVPNAAHHSKVNGLSINKSVNRGK
ncbi:DEKNAAC105621 [Brettanomyces naardenensis]|uniref:TBP-associated factor 12 n=1 Tax=Brettanomyces naardenensis TaxID=13370 RepID=A0A448YTW9_BRENA|nr:DEKNAAC105621 [Brettanomyces naardenensis]